MPELRRDPLTGAGVIVAENRGDRPQEFGEPDRRRKAGICPFCEGNEHETPPEVSVFRAAGTPPDGPGWRVRIVPNRYPALLPVAASGGAPTGDGKNVHDLAGIHEVVIESSHHLQRTSEFTEENLTEVLLAYRDRLNDLKSDRRLRYAVIFKNVGPGAGATIEHAHSQLIGLPLVPDQIGTVGRRARRFRGDHGSCLFCKVTGDEVSAGHRVIAETADLVAFCPFASRVPYEVRIAPRGHAAHFSEIKPDTICQLARLLRAVLTRIDNVLNRPDYNYIIHTAPFDMTDTQDYHWHIAVLPRLTTLAGFEWGTGCTINAVSPESAARQLKIGVLPCEKIED